jgi:quercetin dioxygenase-like cupin family protein
MVIADYHKFVRFDQEKMAKVNLFESHRMFADLYCLLPGQQQRVHTHADNDKIYFLLEGECTCTIGDERHRMTAGETCVAKATVPHGIRNDSDAKAVLLVVMAPHPAPPEER